MFWPDCDGKGSWEKSDCFSYQPGLEDGGGVLVIWEPRTAKGEWNERVGAALNDEKDFVASERNILAAVVVVVVVRR